MSRTLTDAEATSTRLGTTLAGDFARLTPLVRWLNGVLGLEPLDAR